MCEEGTEREREMNCCPFGGIEAMGRRGRKGFLVVDLTQKRPKWKVARTLSTQKL